MCCAILKYSCFGNTHEQSPNVMQSALTATCRLGALTWSSGQTPSGHLYNKKKPVTLYLTPESLLSHTQSVPFHCSFVSKQFRLPVRLRFIAMSNIHIPSTCSSKTPHNETKYFLPSNRLISWSWNVISSPKWRTWPEGVWGHGSVEKFRPEGENLTRGWR